MVARVDEGCSTRLCRCDRLSHEHQEVPSVGSRTVIPATSVAAGVAAPGPSRLLHPGKTPDDGANPPSPHAAMQHKMATPEAKEIYKARKWIVEAPIGQIKEAMGFRRFLLRGLQAVRGEWALVCTAHNLLKLWRHGPIAE